MRRLALLAALPLALSPVAGVAGIKPGAFLQYDFTRFEGTPPAGLDDSSGWRRSRLSLGSPLPRGGELKIEHDFTADVFTDALVRFPLAGGRLTINQYKQPFSADALQSDASAFLTEASAAAAFAPGRRLGVMYARGGFSGSVYGRDLHDSGPEAGVGVRYFRTFGNADGGLWHLAGAAALESPQDSTTSFRLRPDVGPRSGSWQASGSLAADRLDRLGVEAGWQRGKLLLLGELLHLRLDPPAGPVREASGGYVTAAWTLHGAARSHSNGLFAPPKASAGWLGQVELVARYSELELPRAGGGSFGQQGLAVGVNAQLGRHGRLQLARHADQRDADGADARSWTLRLQLTY